MNRFREPILEPSVVIYMTENFGCHRLDRIVKSCKRIEKFRGYGLEDIMIGNEKEIIDNYLKGLRN